MARKADPGISRAFGKDGRAQGWRVVIDVGRGRKGRSQLRRTFNTLDEAKKWRSATISERDTGTYVAAYATTVSELLDTWMLGARHLKPSTRHGYEVHLKPVRAVIGSINVQKLTKRHVERLVEELLTTGGQVGHGRSASTVRQSLIILQQAVDDAVKQGLVVRNVVRLVSKPRLERREMRTWTARQLAAFLSEASRDRYACLWRLAAFGPRRSEVMGVRWDDVDFDRSEVRIVQTRVDVDGRTIVVGEPKTRSGRRTIPVDAVTLEAFRRFKRQQARERLVGGEAYLNTGFVAVDELGRPLRPDTFGNLFARLAKAAGLPSIRLHDLRHTAATLMHESGQVTLRTLADMLGHADPAFTLRTYAHSSDDAMTAASSTLATLFEADGRSV
jgi:integrase